MLAVGDKSSIVPYIGVWQKLLLRENVLLHDWPRRLRQKLSSAVKRSLVSMLRLLFRLIGFLDYGLVTGIVDLWRLGGSLWLLGVAP